MKRTQRNTNRCIPLLIVASALPCVAFAPSHRGVALAAKSAVGQTRQVVLHLVTPDASWANTLTTAVDVFDGSGIDPVVVSDAFWTRLQGNFISVLIGNFLAAIVFAFIMSQASAQLSKLGAFVTNNIFKDNKGIGGGRASTTTFRRADAPPALDIDFGKLIICIAIDVIGSASELVPVLGEVTDVVWAPIAGLVLRTLFGSNILFALEFAEEILPFTDIIPLATLCWVIQTFFSDSNLANALGIGRPEQVINGSSNVIDVEASSDVSRRLPEGDSAKRR